jgi:hypothetical protein
MDDWQTAPSTSTIFIIVVIVIGIVGLIILLIVAWNSGKNNNLSSSSQHDNIDDIDDEDDPFDSGQPNVPSNYEISHTENVKVSVPPKHLTDAPAEKPQVQTHNTVSESAQKSAVINEPDKIEASHMEPDKQVDIPKSETIDNRKDEKIEDDKSISASGNSKSVNESKSEDSSVSASGDSLSSDLSDPGTSKFNSEESLDSLTESSIDSEIIFSSSEDVIRNEKLASVEDVEPASSSEVKNIISSMNLPKNQVKAGNSRYPVITHPVVPAPYVPVISGSGRSSSSTKTSHVEETSGRSMDASISNPASFSSDFSSQTEVSTVRPRRRKSTNNPILGIVNIGRGNGRR